MRISTIMTVYNNPRYVAQALESVLAQTLPSDEIIVVDDGSTDRTLEILQAFATKVRIIPLAHVGLCRALNVAIASSTGDTLAFLDSDDLWQPEKLQIQCAALSADKDLEAVFGAVQQFVSPELDSELKRKYVLPDGPQPGISKNALLIRRDAFQRIGLFDEESTVSDFVEWYARANVLGLRWRMLPEIVALRRQHSANTGRLLRSAQHSEILLALKRSLDLRRSMSQPKERG
jgi:glycosyltransferase involved in cell wall biosynthesis